MAADARFIADLREAFAAHADPARAEPMRAYMKSALPFYGIAAPLRRKLTAALVKAHPQRDLPSLIDTMRALWRGASHREEWYAAMELARVGPHRRLIGIDLLPLYEEMIIASAWWDCCDDISAEGIGALLLRGPDRVKPVLGRWAKGPNLWLRRAAIICQRRLKSGFDPVLLYETILPSIGDQPVAREFFIRKGIGWALRERSYAAPDEVAEFCRQYAKRLSPLTLREALRVIRKRAANRLPAACLRTGPKPTLPPTI